MTPGITFRIVLGSFILSGCSAFISGLGNDHDVQFVQIFYHSGMRDELDTFHGTYQKDLIPGTVKTAMWLTTREQEIILTNLERIRFFSFPDMIPSQPNVSVSPDFGQQVIRIKYKDQDKTVIWHDPTDSRSKVKRYIENLRILLDDIIVSKPEYKALPSSKGGYM